MTKSSRARLAALKGTWRDQLFWDFKLSHLTFKVGYFFADRITLAETAAEYRRSGKIEIWGSQKNIASAANCNISYVSDCINQLITRGHLRRIQRGNQTSKGSNVYRVIVKPVTPEEAERRKKLARGEQ